VLLSVYFAAKRRILLSGTPVQNDLQEFYAMMNLVHPGLLGTPKMFQKLFAGSELGCFGRSLDS
jgi:SNF2 family DNA or RNA helicase